MKCYRPGAWFSTRQEIEKREAMKAKRPRARGRRLTPEQREEIVARNLAGETQVSLAKAFECSQTAISVIVRAARDKKSEGLGDGQQ